MNIYTQIIELLSRIDGKLAQSNQDTLMILLIDFLVYFGHKGLLGSLL
jgi:hypothetical protein